TRTCAPARPKPSPRTLRARPTPPAGLESKTCSVPSRAEVTAATTAPWISCAPPGRSSSARRSLDAGEGGSRQRRSVPSDDTPVTRAAKGLAERRGASFWAGGWVSLPPFHGHPKWRENAPGVFHDIIEEAA